MKHHKIHPILILIGTIFFSPLAHGQSDCMQKNLNEVSAMASDTITRTVGHAFIFTKREDMPFYEEFPYTFKEGEKKYFVINRSNPSTQYGVKLLDKSKKEISLTSSSMHGGKFAVYGFKVPQNGRYVLVIYSKEPDNSCASVSLFIPKRVLKAEDIPVPGHLIKRISTNPKMELLKSISNRVQEEVEMPYYKEVKFIFSKGTRYVLIMEANRNLKVNLINLKNELIPLSFEKNDGNRASFICEQTGIYNIVIYQKNPLSQSMTLDVYRDMGYSSE